MSCCGQGIKRAASAIHRHFNKLIPIPANIKVKTPSVSSEWEQQLAALPTPVPSGAYYNSPKSDIGKEDVSKD